MGDWSGISKDPIYRESAMALEELPGVEVVSWMADLLTILRLPETAERS